MARQPVQWAGTMTSGASSASASQVFGMMGSKSG